LRATLKTIPRQPDVALRAMSRAERTDPSRPSGRPTTRKRMSFSARVFSSFRRYSLRSVKRVETSAFGRFQFSVEKA
jgi:hypothetical protein